MRWRKIQISLGESGMLGHREDLRNLEGGKGIRQAGSFFLSEMRSDGRVFEQWVDMFLLSRHKKPLPCTICIPGPLQRTVVL